MLGTASVAETFLILQISLFRSTPHPRFILTVHTTATSMHLKVSYRMLTFWVLRLLLGPVLLTKWVAYL